MTTPLSEEEKQELGDLYHSGMKLRDIFRYFSDKTEGQIRGNLTRLQLHRPLTPEKVKGLRKDNYSVVQGRTIYLNRVRTASEAPDLLVSGRRQRKLGTSVTKGRLKGFPIYYLTLEERATCPETCKHWYTCYGNGMPWAWRHQAGTELEYRLENELESLQNKHPTGFLVRLHVLGDFYSVDYVHQWGRWLDRFSALYIFGYTAWSKRTEIGQALAQLTESRWERFSLRWSHGNGEPGSTTTLWEYPPVAPLKRSVLICPLQTRKTRNCGTCGLCWAVAAKDKIIAFVAHGS